MSTKQQSVLAEVSEQIGTLTLNRPERLNAFDGTMRDEMPDALERLAADADVRAIIITGAGRGFCAGADLDYLGRLIEERNLDEAAKLLQAGRRAITAIRRAPKPVIAAVNGPAAGGGANLALACDIRIASDRASIGETFGRVGLHPDWGGTYFLPRLVGPAKAAELIFSGDIIDAQEAHRLGIFDRVVPHDRLMAETRGLARQLAARPPRALALAKEALNKSLGATLEEMLEFELRAQTECFASEDAREGVRAFLEKREPKFRGA